MLNSPRSFLHAAKVQVDDSPAVSTPTQCSAARRLRERQGDQQHDLVNRFQAAPLRPSLSKHDAARPFRQATRPLYHLALQLR